MNRTVMLFSMAALLLFPVAAATRTLSALLEPGHSASSETAESSRDPRVAQSGPAIQQAAPEVETAETGPIPGTLQGRWLVGEISDDPEAVLEVNASNARVLSLSAETPPLQLAFDPGSIAPHYRFNEIGRTDRGSYHLHLLSDGLALAWDEREHNPDLILARRLGPIPEALQGSWMLVSPAERLETTIQFGAHEYTIAIGDTPHTGRAEGAGEDGMGPYLFMDFGDGRPRLIHLIQVESGVMLANRVGDDEFLVFYRAGSRPDWAEPFLRPRLPAPVPPVGPAGP
ncbi:MAG: hypothetical protein JW797_17010 [Bradymonadales bacterium]|nr:hypothetical protein [Bradymonadales bacterium]